MSGTFVGGRKAAKANKKNDPDFYRKIGAIGGRNSHGGGFASMKVGKDGLTGPERAKIAGTKGGIKSKRGGSIGDRWILVNTEHESIAEFRTKKDAQYYKVSLKMFGTRIVRKTEI